MSLSHCCPNKTGREVMKGRDWRAKTLAGSIVRNDEVVGSIPTSSTKFSSTCSVVTDQFCPILS